MGRVKALKIEYGELADAARRYVFTDAEQQTINGFTFLTFLKSQDMEKPEFMERASIYELSTNQAAYAWTLYRRHAIRDLLQEELES